MKRSCHAACLLLRREQSHDRLRRPIAAFETEEARVQLYLLIGHDVTRLDEAATFLGRYQDRGEPGDIDRVSYDGSGIQLRAIEGQRVGSAHAEGRGIHHQLVPGRIRRGCARAVTGFAQAL